MAPLLLTALLAAAPLTVRVLESEHLAALHLDAAAATCDGAPLPTALDVAVGVRTVDAAGQQCTELAATDALVTAHGESWRYPGRLRLTLEGGTLRLVNEVDVEDYLPAVVEAELGGAKPAALEAQAVASRTFALGSRRRHGAAGHDLCDRSHCQRYRGASAASPASRAAVEKTRGLVLLTGGVALRPAFFHAACGGHTSTPRDVFGVEGPGTAVSDLDQGAPRCGGAPDSSWTVTADRAQLAAALQRPDTGTPVEVLRRDAGGRVLELRAFGERLSGAALVARLGRAAGTPSLPSARFTLTDAEGVVTFTGTGRGHGAGLCQRGALTLAAKGADAAAILRRYFPDARLAPAP